MTGTEICPKCGATMQLREQLVAGANFHRQLADKLTKAMIAAEREKTAEIILRDSRRDVMSKMTIAEVEQLREQLATAIEALEDMRGYDHDRVDQWLAKLREGNGN